MLSKASPGHPENAVLVSLRLSLFSRDYRCEPTFLLTVPPLLGSSVTTLLGRSNIYSVYSHSRARRAGGVL